MGDAHAGGQFWTNPATGLKTFEITDDGRILFAGLPYPKTDWVAVAGKPWVTVSSSVVFDGSDFGQFTAGSSSGGLNEAIKTGSNILLLGRIKSTVSITGFSNGQVLKGRGWSINPSTADFIGDGIEIETAGVTAIDLSSVVGNGAVTLRDFGIRFPSLATTGHGIYSSPGTNALGLNSEFFQNLFVSGVDSNHYNLYLVNTLQGRFDHIITASGLGLYLGETNGAGGTGNCVFTNIRFSTSSTAFASAMVWLNATHSITYIDFLGLQPNLGTEATQYAIRLDNCSVCSFRGVTGDSHLTTSNPNAVYLNGCTDCTFTSVSFNPTAGKTCQYVVNNCNRIYFWDNTNSPAITASGGSSHIYWMGGTGGFSAGAATVSNRFQNPQGFSYIGTPGLPGGTGSGHAVVNTNTTPVRIYLPFSAAGTAFGVHIIDTNTPTDQALPADPPFVELEVGESIYFATLVPSSWVWYGLLR